jgi:hypothetical protein
MPYGIGTIPNVQLFKMQLRLSYIVELPFRTAYSYNQNWCINSAFFRPVYGDRSGGRVKCETSNKPRFLAAEFVPDVYHRILRIIILRFPVTVLAHVDSING